MQKFCKIIKFNKHTPEQKTTMLQRACMLFDGVDVVVGKRGVGVKQKSIYFVKF